MPFYFRKSVRLGRLFRLNLSKTGASVTGRAGRVSANTRGRASVRLFGGWTWRNR
jgi:hypothetical protein